MKKYFKGFKSNFNKFLNYISLNKDMEKLGMRIEGITSDLSKFASLYKEEKLEHINTLKRYKDSIEVSNAKDLIIESYQIALDPQKLKRFTINYNISRYEDEWSVVMGYCQLGGCEMEGINFKSELEANRKAIELTLMGKKPESVSPCSSCYNEYVDDHLDYS